MVPPKTLRMLEKGEISELEESDLVEVGRMVRGKPVLFGGAEQANN